jgi:predicted nuclease of predicted toxin-antitoxin system
MAGIVADESVDQQIVAALRKLVDVYAVAASSPGVTDEEVLSIARKQNAVLLTADKDFGELVFRRKLSTKGVVLLRLAGLSPDVKARIVNAAWSQHGTEFVDAFTVVSRDSIRIRRELR